MLKRKDYFCVKYPLRKTCAIVLNTKYSDYTPLWVVSPGD